MIQDTRNARKCLRMGSTTTRERVYGNLTTELILGEANRYFSG